MKKYAAYTNRKAHAARKAFNMISILMAAYNGEKYIEEQIDSLLKQSVNDFTLWVQDDCSTDGTWGILETYKNRFPGKINLMRNKSNMGAKNNFLHMMANIKDDYVMLCDQDDVWLPGKIEVTLAKMKELEKSYTNKTPLLVHTDLTVADKNLSPLHRSYRKATKRNYNRMDYRHIVTMNNVSGCTAMYNRPLAELVNAIPGFCVMHDFWLQMVAATFGRIGHINDATMLYRQHGANALGAKNVNSIGYKLNRLVNNKDVTEAIHSTYPQAQSMLDVYGDRISPEKKDFLSKYAAIPAKSKLGRWLAIVRLRVFMNGFSRNVAYFLFV